MKILLLLLILLSTGCSAWEETFNNPIPQTRVFTRDELSENIQQRFPDLSLIQLNELWKYLPEDQKNYLETSTIEAIFAQVQSDRDAKNLNRFEDKLEKAKSQLLSMFSNQEVIALGPALIFYENRILVRLNDVDHPSQSFEYMYHVETERWEKLPKIFPGTHTSRLKIEDLDFKVVSKISAFVEDYTKDLEMTFEPDIAILYFYEHKEPHFSVNISDVKGSFQMIFDLQGNFVEVKR